MKMNSSMTNQRKVPLPLRFGKPLIRALLASAIVTCTSAAQQGSPTLKITSPLAGTVVAPGQTISVTITSPANASFSMIGVIGEDPIGFSSTATSVPAQISLTIPSNISSCRPRMLTAVGLTSSGQRAMSDTILIDIERRDLPMSLSVLMSSVTFGVIGEESPIEILATFSDGTILDVAESSYVAYSSSNTNVATVDANGIVTSVATGIASIRATYTLNGKKVQLTIPVTVPDQIMSVLPVSLRFGSQNVGTSGTPQQLTVTNASRGILKIISVGSRGDFSESDNCTFSSPLSAGGTCTINVAFTPTRTGTRTGALSIVNSFDITPTSIPLTGTGTGQ